MASDPVHEEAQGLLMRPLVQTRRRHLALRHYQALRAAFRRELHDEPAANLQCFTTTSGTAARHRVMLHAHQSGERANVRQKGFQARRRPALVTLRPKETA